MDKISLFRLRPLAIPTVLLILLLYMTQDSAEAAHKMLRRNGKLRSCEPCRISKIRCGHETPICEKCQARRITSQCFYHPAPMTKPPGTPRKQPEPRKRVVKPRQSVTRESRGHETLTPLLSPTATFRNDVSSTVGQPTAGPDTLGTSAASVGTTWPTPPESATRSTQGSESARAFYLGSTSYASVFAEEGRPISESVHPEPEQVERTTMAILDETSTSTAFPSKLTGSRFCQMGIGSQIIAKLSPFSFFEKCTKSYFVINKASALEGPLVISALPQIRHDLEQLSIAGDNLYGAFAEITRNTAKPLKVPSTMTGPEFHTLYTGRNLRWETLGLMLVIAGSCAQYTSPEDPIFNLGNGERLDKDKFIEDMIHASNDCITLCQVHGAVNDIMVWLLYNNLMVTSNFYDHAVWRRLGDCISALYAEGIHCEEGFDEPLFLRESRRRIFAAIYRSDKTLATFFGRPPMLAWKFTDRKLPLDIDDNLAATTDLDKLNDALLKLDDQGWNTEGKIWSASWVRLRCQMSVVKERLLDLSLAGDKNQDVVGELQSIFAESRTVWESLPAHLRYDLYNEEQAWTSLDPSITLRMISAYLEYLHMEFQMHRIMRRQTQTAIPAMLEVSMKLLSTVLVFNKIGRSQAYSIQRHFPTVILFYCLPSAGVLALELRRSTHCSTVHLPPTVKRADVIRNLSVLISCLEWVILPGDGNHRLCSELNKMLALVLDEVLNYDRPTEECTPTKEHAPNGWLGPIDGGFFDIPLVEGMEPIPTESEDFLNWLDNTTWNNTYLF